MGLFKNNDEETQEQTRPANPNNMVLIRLLAVGYLMYILYQMVTAYIAGSEDAPSLGLLIAAIVIFAGGSVWIAVITYKQWKQMKEAQQIYNEEIARQAAEEERLEAEKKALEEEFPDDGEYYEEEETEEAE